MSSYDSTIHAALVLIQSELKAPKSQENKFGGYRYRSCEDILEALKPWLNQTDTTLVITDEVKEIGGRVYVCATAEIRNENGSCSVTGFAREAESRKGMDDSQITGAASSYARKYALNGLFAIDDTKDADATNKHGSEPQKPASKPPAEKPKADPRAVMAKRIEADKEAKWFEVVAWEKGPHKGLTLGDVAANGDATPIKQILDYIDPVALEHETAVTRLKDAITEAESSASYKAKRAKAKDDEPDDEGNDVDAPF
jgi:hypothetical protein